MIGLESNIKFSVKNIKDFIPENKGVIIINPPYGNRLGDPNSMRILYKQLGDLFKTKCAGCNVFVFSGNLDALKSIGLNPTIFVVDFTNTESLLIPPIVAKL